MLSMDDRRWEALLGGYRTPYDPRRALAKLQSGTNDARVWEELWNELHHQGDVDQASYASVPHLVRVHRERPTADRNVYDIVAVIGLARKRGNNPDVPTWLDPSYFQAIQDLANPGWAEIQDASDQELIGGVFSIIAIAIAKGVLTYARFLVEYSEDELIELEGDSSSR
jgi:hypothetical protein